MSDASYRRASTLDGGEFLLQTALGKVGFDLSESTWFHRELLTSPDRITRDNPRLVAAERLFQAGSVHPSGHAWIVTSNEQRHWVTPDGTDDELRCSCLWWTKYGGQRGPCKHVLAAQIAIQDNIEVLRP